MLVFLLLRGLLRRPAPATVIYVLVWSAFYIGSAASFEPSWHWPFVVAIQALITCLLLRVGVLAVIVANFAWGCVIFPLTADLTSWYSQGSLLAVGAVVLLAGYGFHTSLAGRSLFKDEMLAP